MVMETAVHSGSYILADNILWYGKVTEPTPANDRFTEGIKELNRMVVEDDRVENVIQMCIRDSPKCITNMEPVRTSFTVLQGDEISLRCKYCEKITHQNSIEITK